MSSKTLKNICGFFAVAKSWTYHPILQNLKETTILNTSLSFALRGPK